MQDERRGFGETSPRRPHANGNNPHRRNGSHRHPATDARPVPFREISDDPVDLVAVQADDELINALAAGMSVTSPGIGGYDADDQVVAMLAAWRSEVHAEPLPEMIDLDTATATVLAASRPPARRARHLVPLAAAAAMIVFTIGGVSIGASEARPGDALWDVSKVLYSERAESVAAAERIDIAISEAKDALTRGEPEMAAQLLAAAEADLGAVRLEEGLAALAEVQSFLEAKAAETPPGQPIEPGTPLASDPTRPVPPGAGTTDPLPSEAATSPSGTDSPQPGDPSSDPSDSQLDSESSAGAESSTTEPSPADETATGEGDPATSDGSTTTSGTAEGGAAATTTPAQSYGSSRPDDGAGTPTASGSESTTPTS